MLISALTGCGAHADTQAAQSEELHDVAAHLHFGERTSTPLVRRELHDFGAAAEHAAPHQHNHRVHGDSLLQADQSPAPEAAPSPPRQDAPSPPLQDAPSPTPPARSRPQAAPPDAPSLAELADQATQGPLRANRDDDLRGDERGVAEPPLPEPLPTTTKPKPATTASPRRRQTFQAWTCHAYTGTQNVNWCREIARKDEGHNGFAYMAFANGATGMCPPCTCCKRPKSTTTVLSANARVKKDVQDDGSVAVFQILLVFVLLQYGIFVYIALIVITIIFCCCCFCSLMRKQQSGGNRRDAADLKAAEGGGAGA